MSKKCPSYEIDNKQLFKESVIEQNWISNR